MGYLGQRPGTGALDNDNPLLAGGWHVEFTPQQLAIRQPFEVFHIALRGPADPSSVLEVWLDTTFYSTAVRGDVNEWDPNQAMYCMPGQTIHLYWDTTTGPAPRVTIFCRQPNPF